MKATWHRASGGFFSQDAEPQTFALFWDYRLANWTFGVRGEIDPSWYGLVIELGPIQFELTYWRAAPRVGDYLADYSPLSEFERAMPDDPAVRELYDRSKPAIQG